MIASHGARISVSSEELIASPTDLTASLRGDARPRSIALADITDVQPDPGDAWDPGYLLVTAGNTTHAIAFSPGDTQGPAQLASLISAARRGDLPDAESLDGAAGIPGFSFVAFDVETANQQWASICQIGMVKVVDGEEVERVSWLCKPPQGMDEFDPYNVDLHGITRDAVADAPHVGELIARVVEFVGDLPLVAHNAQFDATALRNACVATGTPIPPMMFACSLAQARAAQLDVVNHRLPTLAEFFAVALDNHHDACADAAACAGVMVGLARRTSHEGTLMSFVHDAGFALGSIGAARVTPVLRDRSGATRALQAQRVAEGGFTAAVAAVATPHGSNQEGRQTPAGAKKTGANSHASHQRQNTPWQAVATPDTVPEPNPQADPNSPLYGEHVTLTGDFAPHEKGELWAKIARLGGQVGKNVTKKTTILVAGEWATMTSKEKRARELQDNGQDIQIWSAEELYTAIG